MLLHVEMNTQLFELLLITNELFSTTFSFLVQTCTAVEGQIDEENDKQSFIFIHIFFL